MRGTSEWIAERNDIYRSQYWNAVRADELATGIDLFMYDSAVNSGPYQAVKWLQRALGMNDCDGHLGEGTLAALQNHPDHGALISDMASRRLGMLQHLDTWDEFGEGWTKRIVNLKAICSAWSADDRASAPAAIAAHEDDGHAKAYASDVAQPAFDPQQAAIGSGGGAGVAATLQSAQSQIEPVMHASEILHHIYIGLTLAGVVVAIGGMIYAAWSGYKSKKARRAIDGDVTAEVPEGQPA
jgi:lysozyme family protein